MDSLDLPGSELKFKNPAEPFKPLPYRIFKELPGSGRIQTILKGIQYPLGPM